MTPAQRRADALALLAESALAADLDRGTAGDRYQVVVHVEASTNAVAPVEADPRVRGAADLDPRTAVIEVDHGALHVSAETSRRISCDAAVLNMIHDGDGTVLNVGRRTRTIPPAIRRALAARDKTCRFPGCTSRRCDAHHIEHWSDGGSTRLDNLMLLCRRHHRAVHEGGFRVTSGEGGLFRFHQPDGTRLPNPATAAVPVDLADVPPVSPPPTWDGTPLDLAWAIDVLWRDA